jgi:two-component system, NtrC family, sensor histidine kinase HydH
MNIASDEKWHMSDTASVVHDLRNPLSAIHGGAEMLVSSRLSRVQVQRIARNIFCASMQMRKLLEDLLRDARRTAMQVECLHVRELITMAVAEIATRAELQSVHIAQAVAEELVISVDRDRIRRVVVNILVNALEAMPGGGTIRISAITDSRSALIRVRDSGPGIAPEVAGRLFHPFTTAGKAHGIGLGLALSRQAVLDHGGDMWAESSRSGACFALRLPLTSESGTAVAA